MKKAFLALGCASLISLGACTTAPGSSDTLASAGTGAAVGAATGAAVGAVVPGVSTLTGAVVGAAVGGLAGAVWADQNNDGVADGYVREGQYYAGAPGTETAARSCQSVLGTAATGAGLGAAAGAGVGAVASGVSVLTGAVIGAAVGGLAGAVWADQNNDGCVDGYVREGQYYSGSPSATPASTTRAGERG